MVILSFKDLNDKLNTTNVLIKSNQLSSEMMTDTIAGIKRMLDTTYYVGKKNKIKPSVVINNSISQFVSDCIVSDIDDSDTYILQQSSILPPDYTLSTEIEVSSVQGKSSLSLLFDLYTLMELLRLDKLCYSPGANFLELVNILTNYYPPNMILFKMYSKIANFFLQSIQNSNKCINNIHFNIYN